MQDKEAKRGFPLDQSQFEEYAEILRLKFTICPARASAGQKAAAGMCAKSK